MTSTSEPVRLDARDPGCGAEERLARAALSRIGEPDDAALRAAVTAEGPVAVWNALRRGHGPLVHGRLAGLLPRAAEADPEADLARMARAGGRLVCPGDAEWPAALDDLDAVEPGAPYAVWVRGGGDLAALTPRAVAVVGARAATAYGTRVAADFGAGLAEVGCPVVSGGAYGIDGAAHRGALVMGAPTVVVLACGADVSYPRGHSSLFDSVAEAGNILSEAPPGASAMRHRFLSRNRIIAALGLGTVVVEAAVRSGALSTAGHAERLSKPVMAVPGPVGSALSAGCHVLIRERNALLVTEPAHVLEAVSPVGEAALAPVRAPERPLDELSEEARRVLDAVPVRASVTTARIAVTAGMDPRTTTGRLAELASRGYVEREGAGWRLAPAFRRRGA